MKFGILATAVWGSGSDPRQQIAEHREMVTTAEQLGFNTVIAGQHFLGTELRYLQPVPYLTHLSHYAPSMQVALGIILLSLLNPVDVAEQVATLDIVTGGKAIFGVGLGYSDREFKAFGVRREGRVKRFEESISLIRALWSGKEVSHQGEDFVVERVTPAVLPLQRPGPPVWIGGQAEPAVVRAARLGDAWYAPPFPTHAGLARLRSVFLEERARAGLPTTGEFPVRRELIIASSKAEARRMAAQRSAGRYETYLQWGLGSSLDADNSGFGSQAEADIDGRFILGDPESCAAELDRLRTDLGMTQFMLKVQWPGLPHREAMQQLELFGTRVIPLLRKRGAGGLTDQGDKA